MRIPITPTETGGLPSSHGAKEKPPCTFLNPCRKCEIQTIIRGQRPEQASREQASTLHCEHECVQCKVQEHKCKPLSKAKKEASHRLIKAAVEHMFYGKPIKQWDDAIENADIVVKSEASSPAPKVSIERPITSTPGQASSTITCEVPFGNTIKTLEVVPAEEIRLDDVTQGMANNMGIRLMQLEAEMSVLIKMQRTMLDAVPRGTANKPDTRFM
ncbi:hypothetical protein FPSE_00806 [Fusarium pseudograminearum CS3096]|uniref:Uncharacterized protein n=1 Tax=Fusarium pseudograminearum (strain CS3096) TaxID=1028729 RepID=K3VW27_FUSPC|nr:hypothetical protein FPSE_00806 [Fusarium pseudograminearum CS3096]EKJ79058.1 hypothetical protein FPSE_00806 [Fusarium pseudograminearum CS3096]KAF0645289.1 hypothetical protein FPSE5266_00806 [Fusarium pseudograminearum]